MLEQLQAAIEMMKNGGVNHTPAQPQTGVQRLRPLNSGGGNGAYPNAAGGLGSMLGVMRRGGAMQQSMPQQQNPAMPEGNDGTIQSLIKQMMQGQGAR